MKIDKKKESGYRVQKEFARPDFQHGNRSLFFYPYFINHTTIFYVIISIEVLRILYMFFDYTQDDK